MLRMATSMDPVFLAACKLAGIPPSRRQETKYFKQQRGAAYRCRDEAKKQLESK